MQKVGGAIMFLNVAHLLVMPTQQWPAHAQHAVHVGELAKPRSSKDSSRIKRSSSKSDW